MKNVLLIAFVLNVSVLYAQNNDWIWLTDGHKISASDIVVTDSLIQFVNEKGKQRVYENADVFAVGKNDNIERIIYVPDSINNTFDIPQMSRFVQGAYDARKHYKSKSMFWSSAAVGAGAVWAMPLIGISEFWSPIVPATYTATVGIRPEKKNNLPIVDSLRNDDYYVEGYRRVTGEKRMKSSLVGSGVGLLVGFVSVAILLNK